MVLSDWLQFNNLGEICEFEPEKIKELWRAEKR